MNCIGTKKILEILKHGGTGVIPTDTIYGVVASAMSKKAIGRAYKLLKRNPRKPFIVLISSIKDLDIFRVKIDAKTKKLLNQIWPGKISVILPCPSPKFKYLHRGAKTLAFRVPKKASLVKLLKKTGPLVSTSVNPEGEKPAETIREAKKYFGDKIDPIRKAGISESKNVLPKNKSPRKSSELKLSNGVDFYVSGGKMKSLPSTLGVIKNGRTRVLRKGAGKVAS